MRRAIVIGGEGINALGLVQSLGREGVHVISILISDRSVLIRHSKYSGEIILADNIDSAINMMIERCTFEEPVPVFPAGDREAMALDKNRDRLEGHFLYEKMNGADSITHYMDKGRQIELARQYGFHVPLSIHLKKGMDAPAEMIYPCIVKPLVSCEGDKRDILIAGSRDQLDEILKKNLSFTSEVIVQQYIDKDYEYDMMGCSFMDGEVFVPLSDRMVKFNHLQQDTSTVSYIEPLDPAIAVEVEKIKQLMQGIGYVGLFSVEFMHSRQDNKIYFTEINFRNDGENSFIVHCGVNLPYLHYLDLTKRPRKVYIPVNESKKFIWEAIHFSGLYRHDISFREWLGDLKGVDGFLCYYKDDKRPFYYQFVNSILERFKFFKRLLS